jgi:hypothetical protein
MHEAEVMNSFAPQALGAILHAPVVGETRSRPKASSWPSSPMPLVDSPVGADLDNIATTLGLRRVLHA